ncbi:MAG: hypothetical protein IPK13_27960 [Deltaproteobacteria bacterium]|nr:hypothetical protein [Deltaproteobacteria bacterium]
MPQAADLVQDLEGIQDQEAAQVLRTLLPGEEAQRQSTLERYQLRYLNRYDSGSGALEALRTLEKPGQAQDLAGLVFDVARRTDGGVHAINGALSKAPWAVRRSSLGNAVRFSRKPWRANGLTGHELDGKPTVDFLIPLERLPWVRPGDKFVASKQGLAGRMTVSVLWTDENGHCKAKADEEFPSLNVKNHPIRLEPVPTGVSPHEVGPRGWSDLLQQIWSSLVEEGEDFGNR